MEHIPTKLHQFVVSSFRDFMRTDTQTDTQTQPKTVPARSIAGAQEKTPNTRKTTPRQYIRSQLYRQYYPEKNVIVRNI